MEKFTAFIEKKIAPVANTLARQKYLAALQSTFLALIPFMTIGSFALIIISPPMDYTTMDAGVLRAFMYGWSVVANATLPVLLYIYNVTMTLLAVVVSIGIAYNLAKHYKMNTLLPIIVGLSSFLICATMSTEYTMEFTYFDGSGLFTSIVITIASFELFRFLVNKKVGYISLEGGGVPPALADSIGNLVPVTITLLAFSILSYIVMAITGSGIPALLTVILTPVVSAVDSVGGIVILAAIVMLFWWFGIHDTVITGPLSPFLVSNYTANMTAYAAGTAAIALPYIVTEPFWWTFMAIGGSGATFGLAILASTSKSKQIKTVGRLSMIPAFFNINEPLIFGLPLMYNPTMMIPFIVVMPLNALITFLAMNAGIVARTFADPSWNMFCPIGALISTMDPKAVILVLVLIVIDTLIYLPFFKTYEKQKLQEESMEVAQ